MDKENHKFKNNSLAILVVIIMVALLALLWFFFLSPYLLKQKVEKQTQEMRTMISDGQPLTEEEKNKIQNYIGGQKVQDFQNNGVSQQEIDAMIRAYNRK